MWLFCSPYLNSSARKLSKRIHPPKMHTLKRFRRVLHLRHKGAPVIGWSFQVPPWVYWLLQIVYMLTLFIVVKTRIRNSTVYNKHAYSHKCCHCDKRLQDYTDFSWKNCHNKVQPESEKRKSLHPRNLSGFCGKYIYNVSPDLICTYTTGTALTDRPVLFAFLHNLFLIIKISDKLGL